MKVENLEIVDISMNAGMVYEYLVIKWNSNIGFGELIIKKNIESEKFIIDTEYMGKEFAKQVLCKLIDEAEEVE